MAAGEGHGDGTGILHLCCSEDTVIEIEPVPHRQRDTELRHRRRDRPAEGAETGMPLADVVQQSRPDQILSMALSGDDDESSLVPVPAIRRRLSEERLPQMIFGQPGLNGYSFCAVEVFSSNDAEEPARQMEPRSGGTSHDVTCRQTCTPDRESIQAGPLAGQD